MRKLESGENKSVKEKNGGTLETLLNRDVSVDEIIEVYSDGESTDMAYKIY